MDRLMKAISKEDMLGSQKDKKRAEDDAQ